jgi:hypothetical protein
MQKYYEGQLETLNGRMDRLKQESWAHRTGGGKGGPTGKTALLLLFVKSKAGKNSS